MVEGGRGREKLTKGKGHTLILQNIIESQQNAGNKEEEEPVS